MNPFDEIAVNAAIHLKEAGAATEIGAVLIGVKQAQETLRPCCQGHRKPEWAS